MSNPDILSIAIQLAVIKVITDKLAKARKEDLGPQAVDALAPGARLPIKVGGELVGWLSIPQPYTKATVKSEPLFLDWARKNAPTEIVTVEQVRPNFQDMVLESCKKHGGWLNEANGEYEPVPGVEVQTGDPYPKVDPADDAEAVLGRAWRDGLVDITSMVALPAGDGAA